MVIRKCGNFEHGDYRELWKNQGRREGSEISTRFEPVGIEVFISYATFVSNYRTYYLMITNILFPSSAFALSLISSDTRVIPLNGDSTGNE